MAGDRCSGMFCDGVPSTSAATTPDLRHRQGRRRQVNGSDRPGGCARRTPWACARIVADMNGEASAHEPSSRRTCSRISVDPQRAMEEYLSVKVGGPPASSSARAGCSALLRWRRPGCASCSASARSGSSPRRSGAQPDAEPYDLTIVDAPASGHGAALLRTPRTFAEIAKVGPIANQASAIAETSLTASSQPIVAVAIPEELAVAETLELDEALNGERLTLDRDPQPAAPRPL